MIEKDSTKDPIGNTEGNTGGSAGAQSATVTTGDATKASIFEHFKGVVFYILPQHLISRLTFALTRIRSPLTPLIQLAIRAYIRFFNVNMQDAMEEDIDKYLCFNDFFTRALKPTARPVNSEPNALVSPCDGTVGTFGQIDGDTLLQIKGQPYTLQQLLVTKDLARQFENAYYCTLYLSPADYHRVHMPTDGTLSAMTHIRGRLFSVARYAWKVIPRLFARNERVVNVFENEHGLIAPVMVGALNVGCIETVWYGVVAPDHASYTSIDYDPQANESKITLRRGEEMGRFNMGSTVVLLFTAKDGFEWDVHVRENDTVKMGQMLGRFKSSSQPPMSGGSGNHQQN